MTSREVRHVQPVVPVGRAGRSRRRTIVSVAMPMVLLAATVALALPEPDGAPVAPPTQAAFAPATPALAPPVTPSATSPPAGPFPGEMFGLPILDAASVGRLARAGVDPDRPLAVVGWLTLAPADPACGREWQRCRRIGLLSDVPTVDGGGALFLETRPDLAVSGAHRPRPRRDAWSVASPAVVVGRFAPRIDRECGLRRPRCERVFTVERLGWLGEAANAPARAVVPVGAASRAWR